MVDINQGKFMSEVFYIPLIMPLALLLVYNICILVDQGAHVCFTL